MTDNARVLQILQRVDDAIDKIRFVGSQIDYATSDRAYAALAELFALGMRDAWSEPPVDPQQWDGPAEPLVPSDDWSAAARGRLHLICGDLELLDSHPNHASAALRHYLIGLPLLQQCDDDDGALQCIARALRAAVGSQQHESILDEDLRAPIEWAAGWCRSAPSTVRDELELSLVEMVGRLRDPADWSGDVTQTLLHLCSRADELPYRRAVPWLALARWGLDALDTDDVLAFDGLEPFLEVARITGAASDDTVRALIAHALARAEAAEDGTYYPRGQPPAPAKLRAETAETIAKLRAAAGSRDTR